MTPSANMLIPYGMSILNVDEIYITSFGFKSNLFANVSIDNRTALHQLTAWYRTHIPLFADSKFHGVIPKLVCYIWPTCWPMCLANYGLFYKGGKPKFSWTAIDLQWPIRRTWVHNLGKKGKLDCSEYLKHASRINLMWIWHSANVLGSTVHTAVWSRAELWMVTTTMIPTPGIVPTLR